MEDQLPDAPYGIICEEHGKQGLSKESYELQMSMPDRGWICPIGQCYAEWDDERYEKSEGFVDESEDFYDNEGLDWDEVKGDLDYHERKENGDL
jgi:hypothetical protein